jgi:pyrimidine-nucleoside phosphorylase
VSGEQKAREAIAALGRSVDESAMAAVVSLARDEMLCIGDIAELARVLAASGAMLEPVADRADVASTGGPGSLSTLLCPLYLQAMGVSVGKLAVPGRPAGGVDVLATIPGYRAEMTLAEAAAALTDHRHVHLAAGSSWTPLDAAFFRYRQASGAQALPDLATASLLSKKLAMGVTCVGLDVRVAPHGNFGASADAARGSALRFAAAASRLGMDATCFLTDARRPMQPFLGRGEALMAIDHVISGAAGGWLATHAADCCLMASCTVGSGESAAPEPGALRDALVAVLRAHGTTVAAFEHRVAAVRRQPRITLRAECDGYVAYDLVGLRDVLVRRQRGGDAGEDPAGVILVSGHGEAIARGRELMSVRVPEGESDLARELAGTAIVGPNLPDATFPMEVVRA